MLTFFLTHSYHLLLLPSHFPSFPLPLSFSFTVLYSACPFLLALLSPFPRWFVCSLSFFPSLSLFFFFFLFFFFLRRFFWFRFYIATSVSPLREPDSLSLPRSGLFHSIDIYPSPLGELAEWSRWLVPSARLLFLSRGGQRVLILCRKVVRNPPDPFGRPRMTLILKYYLGPPPVRARDGHSFLSLSLSLFPSLPLSPSFLFFFYLVSLSCVFLSPSFGSTAVNSGSRLSSSSEIFQTSRSSTNFTRIFLRYNS